MELVVENLSVDYSGLVAVDSVNLSVRSEEVVALVGPNGAGKSTLLGAIMGVRSGSGSIRIGSDEISQWPPHRRVQHGLAIVPEGRRVLGTLTVTENMLLGGYWLSKDRRSQKFEEVSSLFPALGERGNQVASTLSGGEQQMLAIARALMSDPEIILLDEPSMGLAPKIVEDVKESIAQLQTSGKGVLLVEQNASVALEVSDSIIVMTNGRVVERTPADRDSESEALVRAYLT